MDHPTVEDLMKMTEDERYQYFLANPPEGVDPRVRPEFIARSHARFVPVIARRDAEQAAAPGKAKVGAMIISVDLWIGLALSMVIFPAANIVGRFFGAQQPRLTVITVSGQLVGVAIIMHRAFRIMRRTAKKDELLAAEAESGDNVPTLVPRRSRRQR